MGPLVKILTALISLFVGFLASLLGFVLVMFLLGKVSDLNTSIDNFLLEHINLIVVIPAVIGLIIGFFVTRYFFKWAYKG